MFSMEDSRDAFNIPHDLRIYKEVFKVDRATRENAFWTAYDIPKVCGTSPFRDVNKEVVAPRGYPR